MQPGTTGEQGSIRTRPARVPARAAAKLLDTPNTRGVVMKIGDLVQKTYGEGRRPIAIVVGWYEYGTPGSLALVLWPGETSPVAVACKYLEVFSESR